MTRLLKPKHFMQYKSDYLLFMLPRRFDIWARTIKVIGKPDDVKCIHMEDKRNVFKFLTSSSTFTSQIHRVELT